MKVLKFGGTSVGNSENIKKVVSQITSLVKSGDHLCIVSSALAGVTNLLIKAGEHAANNELSYKETYNEIVERHHKIISELDLGHAETDLLKTIDSLLDDIKDLLHGINLIKEYTKRSNDLLTSYGEQLSCNIISVAIRNAGTDCTYLDARRLIQTDDRFGNARVDFVTSNEKIKAYFEANNELQVVTGFIAVTKKFETTTLGRGGSDYTASIIAGALNAEEVQIWTDVDGILTADPRKVKRAFPLKEVTYIEAMEMSHFGAKVIYPPTVLPLIKNKIPIRIKNTFNPDFNGTLISEGNEDDKMVVKGVSSIDDLALINVEGGGMVGVTGIAARLFKALSRNDINIILITQASSEFSICLAVDPENAELAREVISEEFELEIKNGKINKIEVDYEVAVVAVIGEHMKRTPGISAKLFTSLGRNGINVIAVAQGSSEYNVSVVISKTDLSKALNSLHEAFFLSDKMTLNVFMIGVGLIGGTLMTQMQRQMGHLLDHNNIRINIVAIANSKKMLLDEKGIDISKWKQSLESEGTTMNVQQYFDKLIEMNLSNSVFVDSTSSAAMTDHYYDVLNNSISIVTP
ncbi:MAG: aspartate kinase, partial [Bacteroidia bacterium]|nr:aspartate kinase [Bacteroidia bacterium]